MLSGTTAQPYRWQLRACRPECRLLGRQSGERSGAPPPQLKPQLRVRAIAESGAVDGPLNFLADPLIWRTLVATPATSRCLGIRERPHECTPRFEGVQDVERRV
jgi:hypothetical protein